MVLGFSIKREDLRVVVGSASAVFALVTLMELGASSVAACLSRAGLPLRGAMLVDSERSSKRVVELSGKWVHRVCYDSDRSSE
jgi:hypothetical protein